MYRYKAKVISVYDGDTIRVRVDLGFNISAGGVKGESVRLYGINAPEVRGKSKVQGKKSRDYLRELLLGKDIVIETIKDKKGKYGRYLANVFLQDKDGATLFVNKNLVDKGYAVNKQY